MSSTTSNNPVAQATSAPSTQPPNAMKAARDFTVPCAMLANGPFGPIIAACGAATPDGLNKISVVLQVRIGRSINLNPSIGFTLGFPLDDRQMESENAGFGVRSRCKSHFSSLPVFTVLQSTN